MENRGPQRLRRNFEETRTREGKLGREPVVTTTNNNTPKHKAGAPGQTASSLTSIVSACARVVNTTKVEDTSGGPGSGASCRLSVEDRKDRIGMANRRRPCTQRFRAGLITFALAGSGVSRSVRWAGESSTRPVVFASVSPAEAGSQPMKTRYPGLRLRLRPGLSSSPPSGLSRLAIQH